jgi:uncharacterized protein YfaS (alpha-2-macroglobulin family)
MDSKTRCKRILAALALAACSAMALAQTTAPQPRIVQVHPQPGEALTKQGAIALQLAGPLPARVQAQCDVWGLRSAVPVEVLQGKPREEALRGHGVPEGELATDAPKPWVALRCRTGLPDGVGVSLQWLHTARPAAGEEDPTGVVRAWNGQRVDYRAFSQWPLLVTCIRSNASAGCSPLDKVTIALRQDVVGADLAQVRLKAATGKLIAPRDVQTLAAQDWAMAVEFGGLAADQRYQIVWPKSLRTRNGQDLLANARHAAPLSVRTGDYPPLVKFGANFGIVEQAEGGVVPLTVRAVEGRTHSPKARLRDVRITDEATMVLAYEELMRVTTSDDSRAHRNDEEADEWEPSADAGETAAPAATKKPAFRYAFPAKLQGGDTRGTSWLRPLPDAHTRDLPSRLEGRAFEVLGVPLTGSGMHLLEVESRALGRGLLDTGRPMFVRSGALVTDLAVHLHRSSSTAALFVTRLSSGQPAPHVPVSLYDCRGKPLAQGRANGTGWATLALEALPDEWSCSLYAFARDGEDVSFVQSRWQRGIESWRFEGLIGYWGPPSDRVVHAVLARNLLRAGETLHARIYWRRIGPQGGLEVPPSGNLPRSVELVHQGSNERHAVPVIWDDRGNGELEYRVPAGAKRGTYRLTLGDLGASGSEFRVEDFRLPLLKAEVLAPAAAQVLAPVSNESPARVATSVRLSYLSGGPAANESVKVYHRLVPLVQSFGDHPDFWFGNERQFRWDDHENAAVETEDNIGNADDGARRLDANGTLQVEARFTKPIATPRTLITEMEYRDPNGETYRAQGRTPVWPAALVLGVKAQMWSPKPDRTVQFLALDPQGRPVAGAEVVVEGGFDGYVSHRRKVVGGYYSYYSERRAFEPKPLCTGRTDEKGLFSCQVKPDLEGLDAGDYRVQAVGRDAQGRTVRVATSMWFYTGGEVWFGQGDHDRMDVIAEQPRYQPGDTASLQVRSPFREATAWVNVMRSGRIVDTLVVPLSGKSPTLKLPIKASYAPNVFINVLAVRGRVAQPAPTALVDLARPAFKVGIAVLDVASDQQLLKVAVRTDRSAYQTREKAKVSIQVTPQAGVLPAERDVTVLVVDEALLELMPNPTWELFRAMTARQPYGFETASAAMQVVGKRHYGRKALPPGGGGGRSAARELFDTLLLWRASVPLDEHGRADVEVPINDSLTRFRVVVVASAGADRFGTGETRFLATKDLQLLSGLPATVRQGDHFGAGFTVRNTTRASMQATVNASLNGQALPPQRVDLPAGEARIAAWPVDVPGDATQLEWKVQAQAGTGDGRRSDALLLRQEVHTTLLPLRYSIATRELPASAGPASAPVQPPAGAVDHPGEIRVSLAPILAADASGVREYMRFYPFYCLEQRTSKAVSLKDTRLWSIITDNIDSYITGSGLLAYYPQESQGYDVLTSYVLAAAHEAGWQLPPEAQQRTLDALEQFVRGKLDVRYDYYHGDAVELTGRKLLALEALSRYRKLEPALADSLSLDLPALDHRSLVEWLAVLNRSDWPDKQRLQAAAVAELDRRLVPDGRGGLRLTRRESELRWYLMWSEPVSQVRLALLALDLPALKHRAGLIALGAVHMQQHGAAWWDTQANVWGALMLDKRAAQATGKVTGTTTITVGNSTRSHDWAKLPLGETYTFPVAESGTARSVAFVHRGTGAPSVQAAGTAWTDLKEAQNSHAQVTRSVRPVRQAVPGRWSAGDIAEVQLRFRLKEPTGWLVLSDPVPTGATILGSGLKGQETVEDRPGRRGWRNADGSWEPWVAYVERTFTTVRVYYEYLWGGGDMTYTYQVRMNNAGTFRLPPTQLETMYQPDVYAREPNGPLEVK